MMRAVLPPLAQTFAALRQTLLMVRRALVQQPIAVINKSIGRPNAPGKHLKDIDYAQRHQSRWGNFDLKGRG